MATDTGGLRVAILGATGAVGTELLRLLEQGVLLLAVVIVAAVF
jgi:aspartate-semialdehyde dehydrogenase